MKTDRNKLFKMLEPPPGGAQGLQRRLEQDSVPRAQAVWKWALASLVAAVLVLLAVELPHEASLTEIAGDPATATGTTRDTPLVASRGTLLDAPEFDRLLGRPSAVRRLEVRRNDQEVAVLEIPGANPRIRIYTLN